MRPRRKEKTGNGNAKFYLHLCSFGSFHSKCRGTGVVGLFCAFFFFVGFYVLRRTVVLPLAFSRFSNNDSSSWTPLSSFAFFHGPRRTAFLPFCVLSPDQKNCRTLSEVFTTMKGGQVPTFCVSVGFQSAKTYSSSF